MVKRILHGQCRCAEHGPGIVGPWTPARWEWWRFSDALGPVCEGQELLLLHIDGVDVGDLVGRISPRVPNLAWGTQSFRGEVLGEGVAQAHEHTALDLPLDGDGVDHLAGVVGGLDLFHPAVVVQHHHMGGEAVGHVALGVGLVGAQLVGGVKKLSKILRPSRAERSPPTPSRAF